MMKEADALLMGLFVCEKQCPIKYRYCLRRLRDVTKNVGYQNESGWSTNIICSTDVFQDISTLPVVSWILLDSLGILGAFAKSEKQLSTRRPFWDLLRGHQHMSHLVAYLGPCLSFFFYYKPTNITNHFGDSLWKHLHIERLFQPLKAATASQGWSSSHRPVRVSWCFAWLVLLYHCWQPHSRRTCNCLGRPCNSLDVDDRRIWKVQDVFKIFIICLQHSLYTISYNRIQQHHCSGRKCISLFLFIVDSLIVFLSMQSWHGFFSVLGCHLWTRHFLPPFLGLWLSTLCFAFSVIRRRSCSSSCSLEALAGAVLIVPKWIQKTWRRRRYV